MCETKDRLSLLEAYNSAMIHPAAESSTTNSSWVAVTDKQREASHIKDEAVILVHKIFDQLTGDKTLFDHNYNAFEEFLKLNKIRHYILYAAKVI